MKKPKTKCSQNLNLMQNLLLNQPNQFQISRIVALVCYWYMQKSYGDSHKQIHSAFNSQIRSVTFLQNIGEILWDLYKLNLMCKLKSSQENDFQFLLNRSIPTYMYYGYCIRKRGVLASTN